MRKLPIVLGWMWMAAGLCLPGCGETKQLPGVEGGGGVGGEGGARGEGGGGGDGGAGGEDGGGGVGGSEEGLQIPGLGAEVEVALDQQGILHASCQSDADCMAVLGYFHAQNRFFQMDLQRRAARGRLATLIPIQYNTDRFMRHYMSTTEGEPIEEAIWKILDEDTKSILEAYASGVNAWLEDLRAGRNGATLSEEYGLALVIATPETIPDWEPLDSVAFARLMVWTLSDSMDKEQTLGLAFPKLPADLAVDLFTLRPGMKSYTVPEAEGRAFMKAPMDLEAIRGLQGRLDKASGVLAQALQATPDIELLAPKNEPAGSNNWVVAPGKTAAGKALLANDPHLGLSNPSVWYFAEIDSKTRGTGTLHMAGASFPGVPGIPIGFNENVAWGATVAYYDVTDVYVEELNAAGDAVIFNGEEVKLVSRSHTFEIAGQPSKTDVLEWVPHHGPVIAKDVASRLAVSVRWTGHEPTNELRAFLGMGRAKNLDEAKAALRHFEVGAQNFVMIDTDGTIGWYPHANVPTRPWASYDQADPFSEGSLPPWMPLPGDGRAEWGPYVAAEQLPQLVDPPRGFIVTANQDLLGATEDGDPTNDGHPMLQGLVAPGFRMARVVDLLEAAGDSMTPEMMGDFQGDTFSYLGELIVPKIAAAAEGAELSATAQALLASMVAWDRTCPTGLVGHDPKSAYSDVPAEAAASIGCMAFHYTLPRILEEAYGDELAAISADGSVNLKVESTDANLLIRPLVIALTRPEDRRSGDALWNVYGGAARTQDEVLLRGLTRAATEIVAPLGADPNGWRWGRKHTVTFKTELSMLAPNLDLGPYATPGGQFTVNVANPGFGGKSFTHGSGASLRMVSEASAGGIVTWMQLPGGQDLHRDGLHYGDLVEAWIENRSFHFLFERDEVDELAQVKIVAKP